MSMYTTAQLLAAARAFKSMWDAVLDTGRPDTVMSLRTHWG